MSYPKYNATPPTLTDGARGDLQVDVNGNLKVAIISGGGGAGGGGDASAANQTVLNTEVGIVTEAAPATDTASSGLNGRLQRIAQRLTSIIALLPAALGAGGGLKIDGSGTALPVSGTITANAGSGNFAITAASLPLPTGAATDAKLPAFGVAGTASADVITVQGRASMTALKVDGSAVTQPVSGTFWQATQPVSIASMPSTPVTGTFWQATQPVSGPMTSAEFLADLRSTAAASSVASSATSVTVLASNASRKGAIIVNTDANVLYLDLTGGTASATLRYSTALATGDEYEVPFGITGAITGIWASAGSGKALVTEAS